MISNVSGIYNVSLGKKIYLKKIINWLNFYNNKEIKYIESPKNQKFDNFTLNNDKLMNTIKIKNSIQELKKYSIKLSKKLFKG